MGQKNMSEKIVWFAACALVATSCSGSCNQETSAQSRGGTPSFTTPGIKQLESMVNLVAEAAATIPRAGFDPAALVEAEGNEPARLFQWVRDNTWWVPYRGVLRGSTGVLLDRVGNSFDRSLLLGELLKRAGHEVRLVHAQLTDAKARAILASLPKLPDRRITAPRPVTADDASKLKTAAEAMSPGYSKFQADWRAAVERRATAAKSLIGDQVRELRGALGATAADGDAEQQTLAALKDHWWVEQLVDEKWVALDTLGRQARVGETNAAATETVDWSGDAPSIDDAAWHEVRIRVIVEHLNQGATRESTVLETTLRPAEIVGRELMLEHQPKQFPPDLLSSLKPNVSNFRSAALGIREWMPMLHVPGRRVNGTAFNDSGEAEGQATAEWVEYETRVPGRQPQRIRRTVFDVLGAVRGTAHAKTFDATTEARRLERAGALLGGTSILLQPCNFTIEFVTALNTAGVVDNREALEAFAEERDPDARKAAAQQLLMNMERPTPLRNLALWRSDLAPAPGDVFLDRPNILTYSFSLWMSDGRAVEVRDWIDIASNGVAVRRGSSRSAADVRVEQGVVDTLAEALAIGGEAGTADNTSTIFAMTKAQSVAITLVASRERTALQPLQWPEDALFRLGTDLTSGFVAVAPVRPVTMTGKARVGWWLVHRQSGDTIGVMDTGFRQAFPERAVGETDHAYAMRVLQWGRDADPAMVARRMTMNGHGGSLEMNIEIAIEFQAHIRQVLIAALA